MRGMTSVDPVDPADRAALLAQIEQYYDAVPRPAARAEDFGPLTLFVREGKGWPFYARPARAWAGPAVSAADVDRVRERQRELGVPESFEWVAEAAPALRAAIEASGLSVHEHPLMVLDPDAVLPEERELPCGAVVRTIGPDDPALATALSVPHLAFAQPGTGIGSAGLPDLTQLVSARAGDGSAERVAERIRAGLTVLGAAVFKGAAMCAGQHQPVGAVSEITGVGTLPTARRRGLGRAVTAALAADARAHGVRTVFLSAGDDDVARIYAGLGFHRVATALIAEPAPARTSG
jgi:ribosomal protein S18 acetylase RimI-like enzyme